MLFIPRRFFIWGGQLIGFLWFDVLRLRRDLVIQNLRLAFPDWSEEKLVKTGRQSLMIVGQNIVDVFLLPFIDRTWCKKQVTVEGLEHVQEALKKEKGVLLLGSHLGSGDLSIASLNYVGLKIHLISKELKTKWLNRFWFAVRGRHGTRFIAPRRSSFDILRALRKNEVVIFVLDQFMGPPLGVRTRFFGHETGTAMGLALMAGRTQAPVVPCYTYIADSGKSVIVFEPEVQWEEREKRELSISHMTQVYTDRIEEAVRKHPDQWLWVHRRWKEFKV